MSSIRLTPIHQSHFGITDEGQNAELFRLTNKKGTYMEVTTFGASITELVIADRHGVPANVVLGFDDLAAYESKQNPYFGCVVGRVANRIAGGDLVIDGKKYSLPINNGPNTLHGGFRGLSRRNWSGEAYETEKGPCLHLTYVSPDGEEGFPGRLTTSVTYTLTHDNELVIDYLAITDKPTVVNLTNHSYFNLAGAGCGDVLSHQLMIDAHRVTAVNKDLIPTGEFVSVKGTALDFTSDSAIGARISELQGGYDHNFVLSERSRTLTFCARVKESKSGRAMEVYTTEPGVQLYTSNHMDGSLKRKGGTYVKYAGVCLETQHFPDSVHHPEFPSTELRPGDDYTSTTIYKFFND